MKWAEAVCGKNEFLLNALCMTSSLGLKKTVQVNLITEYFWHQSSELTSPDHFDLLNKHLLTLSTIKAFMLSGFHLSCIVSCIASIPGVISLSTASIKDQTQVCVNVTQKLAVWTNRKALSLDWLVKKCLPIFSYRFLERILLITKSEPSHRKCFIFTPHKNLCRSND